MARAKRTSSVLETARQRLAGLKSITPAPDFGPTLAIPGYDADITAISGKYNFAASRSWNDDGAMRALVH